MALRFLPPVWIHDGGLNFRSIDTAEEAHAYLRGSRGQRGALYGQATAMMESALSTADDITRARETFREFARNEGVLAEVEAI